jgi:hypothetical protein
VFDSRKRQRTFSISSVSRPVLGPTQPPVQWVPGSFPRSKSPQEPDADHSRLLERRLSKSRSYTNPVYPKRHLWRAAKTLYFLTTCSLECWTHRLSNEDTRPPITNSKVYVSTDLLCRHISYPVVGLFACYFTQLYQTQRLYGIQYVKRTIKFVKQDGVRK